MIIDTEILKTKVIEFYGKRQLIVDKLPGWSKKQIEYQKYVVDG